MNLLERLGGTIKLQNILKDFYDRLFDDIIVGFLFVNTDKQHIITMQHEFLCKLFGATKAYSGKSPATAHRHLPLLPGHFDRRIHVLKQTLLDQKVPQDVIDDWIKLENSLRDIILKNSAHHHATKDKS